jgi:hypothetical protein
MTKAIVRSILRSRVHRFGIVLVFASVLTAGGCAVQPQPFGLEGPGFWMGMLHGLLIVFSFFGSLFRDTRIYAFPNSGVWYDFGFLIGASMFLGGGGSASK